MSFYLWLLSLEHTFSSLNRTSSDYTASQVRRHKSSVRRKAKNKGAELSLWFSGCDVCSLEDS